MRVPVNLSNAFKTEFEPILTDFLLGEGLIPEQESLKSRRYLTRSVAPHVKTLSELFNRTSTPLGEQTDAIDEESYFTEGSNPANRRLAYLVSFMPCNLFRVASVWSELARLGFKWPFSGQEFKAIEFGAGTASGACGILAGEKFAPLGLPDRGSFALIEQSKPALNLGTKWFEKYGTALGQGTFEARPFHRRIELNQPWLPKNAPKFQLFVMSYFLNECALSPQVLAEQFVKTVDRHMEDGGISIIVEPALKLQSRRLLEFRKALLALPEVISGKIPLKLLLPCLGHQACGALAQEDDWCHEEVSWWRPEYLRSLDALVGLDRKTLPFSYLVIQKGAAPLEKALPSLSTDGLRFRLVSPSRPLGQTHEFFICGQDGKRRARWRVPENTEIPNRGDILEQVDHHGDPALTQIEKAKLISF